MTPDRADRVAVHLRAQLAEVIRSKMSDPRLPLLAVSDVRVSRDLAVADVYVSTLSEVGRGAKADAVAVLNHAAGFLRSAIARRHDLRTTPKLRFHYDDLAEEAPRLEALIDRAVEADAKPPSGARREAAGGSGERETERVA